MLPVHLIVTSSLFTLVAGFIIHKVVIAVSHRWRLLDIPSSRRRHNKPIPITGGAGIILTWLVGFSFFTLQTPSWLNEHYQSLLALSTGLAILIVLGLVDDLRGLGPLVKLGFQSLAALIVLLFEPQVHGIMLHWREDLGSLVWPLGMIWIVGATNAINLIDGLDGLAGGTALLVFTSIMILGVWTGESAHFIVISVALLLPAILSFLRYNWHPARIFLGDNGSLPLGFLLASAALMCRPVTRSWVMIGSIILMLGYPILDMGVSVFRRRKTGQPLFKADRTHLHYRILRLGLSVPQTTVLLLSITLYLQATSLALNQMSPPTAALGISMVVFSIFTLLFIVFSIERWRVTSLIQRIRADKLGVHQLPVERLYTVITVDLSPLLEVGIFEEQKRCQHVISALELMLKTMMKKTDRIFTRNETISIILAAAQPEDELVVHAVIKRLKVKIAQFMEIYDLQFSLASLPISYDQKPFLLKEGTEPVPVLHAEVRQKVS